MLLVLVVINYLICILISTLLRNYLPSIFFPHIWYNDDVSTVTLSSLHQTLLRNWRVILLVQEKKIWDSFKLVSPFLIVTVSWLDDFYLNLWNRNCTKHCDYNNQNEDTSSSESMYNNNSSSEKKLFSFESLIYY